MISISAVICTSPVGCYSVRRSTSCQAKMDLSRRSAVEADPSARSQAQAKAQSQTEGAS